ncbi:putative mediator of RNA polymerase II transcription subunit 26 isoform X2 [Leguminivora glycinivorella]|uniref:putative mediator of RNA polymerase II transcription subunit 26 isoform X2 n=1 Tax=Leguminivora glycinivorella TaxID=1035111 RepID=UPI002010C24C|nr:putative mediator of RNA polymerase II transcription subunit 26 isoform X2 [Leguminivora glycinivorella]
MSQRPAFTKWLWCLFAVYAGPGWGRAVSVRTPPKNPTTIEAQAKFFQYRHLPTHEDYEQGHRQGSERHFTERHERAKPSDGLFSAKVRWGDKHGGYGEHYWDLNHAGHAANHGNDEYDGSDDDGSYNHELDHAHDDHDTYDEPSEQVPSYGTEEYDSEQAAKYDENNRAKRAHPRIKTERKFVRHEENDEETPKEKFYRKIKQRQAPQEDAVKEAEQKQQPKRKRRQRKPENEEDSTKQALSQKGEQKPEHKYFVNENEEQNESEKEPQYYVKKNEGPNKQPQYYVKNKNEEPKEQQPQYYVKKNEEPKEQPPQYYVKKNEEPKEQQPQYYATRAENQFVPYEQGAGVRQHQHPELTPAASAPRLFLEPTTGHVVDRATGQAYVLQPIAVNNYN